MDIEDFFRENIKNIYVFGAIFLIIIIIILYFIWRPETSKLETPTVIKYTEVSQEEMDNRVREEYFQEIVFALRYNAASDLATSLNIDKGYLKYRDLTKEQLITELDKQGYLNEEVNISNIVRYEVGDLFVYRGELMSVNKTRDINIIETYPYEYTISFDSVYDYSDVVKTVRENNITYEVIKSVKTLTYTEYKIKITNSSNEFAIFNFNNPTMTYAVLEDNSEYNATVPTVNLENKTTLEKQSSITITLMFRIPLQKQGEIRGIVFKNVQIDEEEADVAIRF